MGSAEAGTMAGSFVWSLDIYVGHDNKLRLYPNVSGRYIRKVGGERFGGDYRLEKHIWMHIQRHRLSIVYKSRVWMVSPLLFSRIL